MNFQKLSADEDVLSNLTTFTVGCILPGDIVVFPSAYLIVEKICNSHCHCLRAPLHLFHRDSLAAFGFLVKSVDRILS